MIRERFAPSPTGLLHLGHAYSALQAYDAAQSAGGQFLLRIEDIDRPRCKPEFEAAIYRDLKWLGIAWDGPVLRQSERLHAYDQALQTLIKMGLCYPCSCTRQDIQNALSAPQENSNFGPDGVIYPGTCKDRSMENYQNTDAIRLDMTKAATMVQNISYIELGQAQPENLNIPTEHMIETCGDIVLARKDIGTSYHVSVVIDDAYQHITHVTRGRDLAPATPIHVLIQRLLGLPTPKYRHHRLIRDENGKRLAKRDDARSLQNYREQGYSPQDIKNMIIL